ncbi:essential nuclear protein 1 [Paragonimus westermani]|uniref:Essential nuclear protein 1 n=1 Tax=Paragonimus westermani TaxID=34504 RepID=A0A5J4NJA6_9TREM|nr:essential nuclear protein 1 [Paragonimus westermani]
MSCGSHCTIKRSYISAVSSLDNLRKAYTKACVHQTVRVPAVKWNLPNRGQSKNGSKVKPAKQYECSHIFQWVSSFFLYLFSFYENYLLPKVKQDIEENRRLCVQLFEALIASMFRPEEFVSGVFLPWIQSEMSKTEGIILAHLIKKATLKARFDKDCSVYFTHENRMPVTWFRSLLLFLESYRHYVKPEERTKLVKLCRQHEHPQITCEIRTLLSLISTNSSMAT